MWEVERRKEMYDRLLAMKGPFQLRDVIDGRKDWAIVRSIVTAAVRAGDMRRMIDNEERFYEWIN